jgi:hypothetical protein
MYGAVTPVSFLGAVLWGLGGVVRHERGADAPHRAAARVSVTASVGYWALLAGRPRVGMLTQGYASALMALVLLRMAVAARPRRRAVLVVAFVGVQSRPDAANV